MTLMIDLRHIRNIIFNAQSNMTHPATWPNTAPTTKMIVQNLTEIWWKRLKCHLHYSPNSAPATKSASWISPKSDSWITWLYYYLTLRLMWGRVCSEALNQGNHLMLIIYPVIWKPPQAPQLLGTLASPMAQTHHDTHVLLEKSPSTFPTSSTQRSPKSVGDAKSTAWNPRLQPFGPFGPRVSHGSFHLQETPELSEMQPEWTKVWQKAAEKKQKGLQKWTLRRVATHIPKNIYT